MGKAVNPQQRTISVKLDKPQFAVLERLVELGEFNGRSHAVRELLLPALDGAIEAMRTGKGYQGVMSYAMLMKKGFGNRYDLIAKNAEEKRTDHKGQSQLDIPNIPDDYNFTPLMGKELLEEN